jgi:hypothetical protein
MNNKLKLLVFVVSLILIALLVRWMRRPIRISNITWSKTGSGVNVKFNLVNRSDEFCSTRVGITVYNFTKLRAYKGPFRIEMEVLANDKLDFVLEPYETRLVEKSDLILAPAIVPISKVEVNVISYSGRTNQFAQQGGAAEAPRAPR